MTTMFGCAFKLLCRKEDTLVNSMPRHNILTLSQCWLHSLLLPAAPCPPPLLTLTSPHPPLGGRPDGGQQQRACATLNCRQHGSSVARGNMGNDSRRVVHGMSLEVALFSGQRAAPAAPLTHAHTHLLAYPPPHAPVTSSPQRRALRQAGRVLPTTLSNTTWLLHDARLRHRARAASNNHHTSDHRRFVILLSRCCLCIRACHQAALSKRRTRGRRQIAVSSRNHRTRVCSIRDDARYLHACRTWVHARYAAAYSMPFLTHQHTYPLQTPPHWARRGGLFGAYRARGRAGRTGDNVRATAFRLDIHRRVREQRHAEEPPWANGNLGVAFSIPRGIWMAREEPRTLFLMFAYRLAPGRRISSGFSGRARCVTSGAGGRDALTIGARRLPRRHLQTPYGRRDISNCFVYHLRRAIWRLLNACRAPVAMRFASLLPHRIFSPTFWRGKLSIRHAGV